MSVLASDNFDRANGAIGANWTTASGCTAFSISSNAALCNDDPESNYWNGVTPPNDQWSEAVLGTLVTAADNGAGPVVRQSTSADTKYFAMANTVDDVRCYKVVAGTYTQIGSTAGAVVSGDTLYIEAQGTAVVVKVNGSNVISTTDSAVTSGRLGIFGANEGAVNPTLTSWRGGDFDAAAVQSNLTLLGVG